MNFEDLIILTVNPLVKGEIQVPVAGKLLFGRYWHTWEDAAMAQEVADRNVHLILNLLEQSHRDVGEAVELWSPIPDFGVPAAEERFCKHIDTVVHALEEGTTVLVHCWGGKGRTSVALAAILVRLGVDAAQALERVHAVARGPETDEQSEFVRDFSKRGDALARL